MSYYYKKSNQWHSVNKEWKLLCKCSFKGTQVWKQEYCKQEHIKHEIPEDCPQVDKKPVIKRGLKEFLCFTKVTIPISIVLKVYFYFTFNAWIYINTEGGIGEKSAKFRIAIITQEYKWKIASVDSIEIGLIDEKLPNLLDNLKGFDNGIGIIAVGTASQEGKQGTEVIRADERADKIASILRTHVISKNRNLYKLNLGQYSQSNVKNIKETATERRVILISILDVNEKMEHKDLEKSLNNALQKPEVQNAINIKKYSNFDFINI
jgi:hypothetical protein